MATGRVPTTANSPLTTKGDLFGYSTTQARVAVGSDGDTLVADSAATVGLRYQGNYAAGKNKIINGDFGIWQRGTSFSSLGYTADRWTVNFSGATGTVSQQTFTAGTAPVAGYEGRFFLRLATTVADDNSRIEQKIEDVRTFAGQTVTVSLWAKADSARTITLTPYQNFGSGGSADVNVTSQTISVTTDWTRFTKTFAIPSITGKTIGTGSFLSLEILHAPNATFTLDLWGVQMEAGSVATAFQTATGTLQGELAACQRYYQLIASGNTKNICNVAAYNATSVYGTYFTKVSMRTAPTISVVTGTDYYSVAGNNGSDGSTTVGLALASENQVRLEITSGIAVTQGYAYWIDTTNASAFLAVQAEL